MHTRTLVLLPPETEQLRDAVTELLRPHRLDEDNPNRPWTHDYWTLGNGLIGDPATAERYGLHDDDLGRDVCPVSRLPKDCSPGAGKAALWSGLVLFRR